MFVGGRWVYSESEATFEAVSPATGEVIATLPKGTRADAARAVEAAHRARAAMAGLGAFERATLLHRVADVMESRREDLARWLSLDQGKPYKTEALGEVGEAVEYFRIAAEDIKRLETNVIPSMAKNKLVFTLRVPRGVYGVITPWNWPLTMATELIAPALAGGNTIVWAPATSSSAIRSMTARRWAPSTTKGSLRRWTNTCETRSTAARPWSRAGGGRMDIRPGCITRPPCCEMCRPRCGSAARRPLVRSLPSFHSPTKPRLSPSRMTHPTACSVPSTPGTSTAPCASPSGSRPAGST